MNSKDCEPNKTEMATAPLLLPILHTVSNHLPLSLVCDYLPNHIGPTRLDLVTMDALDVVADRLPNKHGQMQGCERFGLQEQVVFSQIFGQTLFPELLGRENQGF